MELTGKLRLLHVDDDNTFLSVSKEILEIDGRFEIDCSFSVNDAMRKLESEFFDAIISDWEMPGKTGLDFLKEIRERGNNIPFVLFTGKGREEVAVKALNMGASRYLNKQGDPEVVYAELLSSIVQAVEHSKTQMQLQQSEERFSMLSAATFEGIVISEKGKIVDANNQLADMLGYSLVELLRINWIDLVASESREFVLNCIQSSVESPYECLALKKDGSVLHIEIRARNIYRKGRLARICAIRDISEHKKNEDEILHVAERNYLYLEAGDLGATEYVFKKRILFLDERARNMFGLDKNGEITLNNLFGKIHPEDKRMVEEAANQAIMDFSNAGYQCEFRVVLDDNSTRWITSRGQVFFEGEGSGRKPTRLIGVHIDITRRKISEEALEKASTDLRSESEKLKVLNEKMNVIGSLTRHDVRNKLSSIRASTYLIKKKFGENPELSKFTDQIDEAVVSTTKLLDFSAIYEKMGSEQLKPIKVASFFNQATKLFSGLNKIEVINDLENLELEADSQLTQLFYNLIDNSLKHSPKISKVHIHYINHPTSTSMIYEDNGVGIPETNKSKLFTEGFTTGGTGHGLYLIQKLTKTYGWKVEENGIPGKGARFEFIIQAKP